MAHEIARLLLEHAGTFLERTEAVKTAVGMGMPLAEIEEYLDWLDATRGPIARPKGGPSKRQAAAPVRVSPRVESAPAQSVRPVEVPSPSGRGSG